jgi:hypothetical protein
MRDKAEIAGLKINFILLTNCVTGAALPSKTAGSDLEQESNNVDVGRVAGRAGAKRVIAPSTLPHAFPRKSRPKPTPRAFAAGEVIDFALGAVYGLAMALYASGRAAGGPRRGFVPQAQAAELRFKHASAVARSPRSYPARNIAVRVKAAPL